MVSHRYKRCEREKLSSLSPAIASQTSLMDFDERGINNNDMWEWQDDDYHLKENPRNDISCSLWDELNHSEDSFMYMLEVQTPIKDCANFDYPSTDFGGNIDKLLEECGDSLQQKRRRMLHFPLDADETASSNVRSTSVLLRYKDREEERIDDGLSSSLNVEWNSQENMGLPEGNCAFNSESWDQPSEGWLDSCFDESVMQNETDETTAPIQDMICDEASNLQGLDSELYDSSIVKETDFVQECQPSTLHKIGRKSSIETLTKLTTSVAYPFTLIKPCGVAGDLTLKDINQRLLSPPPSSEHMQDENSLLCYPTSAFSGKPVVVKTKIRTEGGKGSITIMRTKG